ncbi:MAG: AAA family ATPase [Phycisphaerae bacterium]|nr:AAA family ATPase [Phycisphaerae bacterium]
MSDPLRGMVERVYHGSPGFTAGVLRTDDGRSVRFAGKVCVSTGEAVALVGRWRKDAKYGPQFAVEFVRYELPRSPEGLVQYLAKHPAFTGIGEATARRIVTAAGSADGLDRLLAADVNELHHALRIPMATLETLRDAWRANAAENEIRSYLAGFGLTHHQMETLLTTFGNAVVGLLRADPYQIIKHIHGYGFKKVDKIARAMGTPKDHPGRLEAGLRYTLQQEIDGGHTWTGGADLIDKANDTLLLDTLDSREVIRGAGDRLLREGALVAHDSAVTVPELHEAERLIHATLTEHATTLPPLLGTGEAIEGLRSGQVDAYRTALRHGIALVAGGAGTGKTYVLARLARTFQAAGLRMALCSPTGKAAKRIEASLRAQGVGLEAKTIHRLLRYDGTQFHCGNLSTGCDEDAGYDVVIVDEVSMVDVVLMAALLRRIDFTRTRLLLFGDHNQLPPVGPGNVLRDLIQHRLVPQVVLDEVVRQAGALKTNCSAILDQTIAPTTVGDPAWTVVDVYRDAQQIQLYLRELLRERIPRRLGLDPVRDVQVITPTHRGLLGTRVLNPLLQRLLNGQVEGRFAPGDKVIQTTNDYERGVMNGTIGYVLGSTISGGWIVDFEGVGPVTIEGDRLPNVQLAYALTAHKAQGSEFPCAVVLCHRAHYFADRNWLYTAVTRAARYCILIGDRWGLRAALRKDQVVRRRTFLDLWSRGKGDGIGNDGEGVHG